MIHSFVIFLPLNVLRATKSPPLQHCRSREYWQPILIITIWLFVAGPSRLVDMWEVTFSDWQKAFQCPHLMLMVDAHQIWRRHTKKAPMIGHLGVLTFPVNASWFYCPTTCLPGVISTFWNDIWVQNKWTWAAQPLCHHGPRVHWIDLNVLAGVLCLLCRFQHGDHVSNDHILQRSSALKFLKTFEVRNRQCSDGILSDISPALPSLTVWFGFRDLICIKLRSSHDYANLHAAAGRSTCRVVSMMRRVAKIPALYRTSTGYVDSSLDLLCVQH